MHHTIGTSTAIATLAAALALTVSACAGPTGPHARSQSSPTATTSAVDPNAPEVVEPGDIPDDQAFVTYQWNDGSFSVDIPEGWARTSTGNSVSFTDKYNSITVTEAVASAPPTPDSVRAKGLRDVSKDPTFHLGDVTQVTRSSGPAVLATYEIGSTANPVTGKKALLAVERYYFARAGRQVMLTLSGAKGADNVDPWRTVTDSLVWK